MDPQRMAAVVRLMQEEGIVQLLDDLSSICMQRSLNERTDATRQAAWDRAAYLIKHASDQIPTRVAR